MRDLFLTEEWFRLLAREGLAPPPRACQVLGLRGGTGEEALALHLKQDREGEAWSSLSNYYAGVYGPSGESAYLTADDWALALREVRQWPGGGVLQLSPLDADSAWLPAFKQGARRVGYRVWEEPAFGNWFQPVEPGVYTAYWQARPSALRNTVDRATRKLDRAGDWRVEIFAGGLHDHAAEAAVLGRMTDAYLHVYANSWKPQEPRTEFMPAFIAVAARQGCLRLGVLWLQGRPLAAQIWLV
ncbi:MAG: GNAT family N-acetyltransferase, partial [Hydrogenophaga sp.]|uniref:GNAT family N-acetyltransferase n=1 Tax=Hydrogenophaga sp. TaxID=1904254 RepID=UPI003D9BB50A